MRQFIFTRGILVRLDFVAFRIWAELISFRKHPHSMTHESSSNSSKTWRWLCMGSWEKCASVSALVHGSIQQYVCYPPK